MRIPGYRVIGKLATFDSSRVSCPAKPGSTNPAVEWISRPRRPSDDLPSRRATRSSGSTHPLQGGAQHELAGVQDERVVGVDLHQGGELRQVLLHVDMAHGVVAEHPEAVPPGAGPPTTAAPRPRPAGRSQCGRRRAPPGWSGPTGSRRRSEPKKHRFAVHARSVGQSTIRWAPACSGRSDRPAGDHGKSVPITRPRATARASPTTPPETTARASPITRPRATARASPTTPPDVTDVT